MNWLLKFLSVLYGGVVRLRNRLFDKGWLPGTAFRLPVISLGNVTVGGTGKTPHTEYLLRLLKDSFSLAVLSRGYGRSTRGFVLVKDHPTVEDVGDEPLQMYRKFPDVPFAVQEKRVPGIQELLRMYPKTQAVLLDDAFQHRYVKPSLSIVIMDYGRPIYADRMLPAGRLREPAEGIRRADVVVVSKCPPQMDANKQQEIIDRLPLRPGQQVFFSTIEYGRLQPACPEQAESDHFTVNQLCFEGRPVMGFCGIGAPQPFQQFVSNIYLTAECLVFPDHHQYSWRDVDKISEAFERIREKKGIIVTTEKDYYHLLGNALFEELLPYIYYVRLEIRFIDNRADEFNQLVSDHVRNYPTDSPMA